MKFFLILFLGVIFGLMVLMSAFVPYAGAADILVPCDHPTIQEAIDNAGGGDVIFVEPGTYYENINFLGKGVTVKSTDPDDPNVVMATIIDGNEIDSVVAFSSGEESDSVLSGLTLRNGYSTEDYGGGISCLHSSPTITKCIIRDNKNGGIYCFNSSPEITSCLIIKNLDYGIYCLSSSSPIITDCIISANGTSGIICEDSSPIITNCIIGSNGNNGVSCWSLSSPTLTDCTIRLNFEDGINVCDSSPTITNCNVSENNDDGISYNSSSPTIKNCTINKNQGNGIKSRGSYPVFTNYIINERWRDRISFFNALMLITNCTISENGSSGIFCSGSSPTITKCNISDNNGSGIICQDASSPAIINCVIAGNSSNHEGGGIYCFGEELLFDIPIIPMPTITNCTIVNNSATHNGGGIYSISASPIVTNCIIWENFPDEISVDYLPFFGTALHLPIKPIVAHSNVKSGSRRGYPGLRNINVDPLFVNPTAGDYNLQAGSPCIKKGKRRTTLGAYGIFNRMLPWGRSNRR